MFDLKLRRIFLIVSLPYFLILGAYLLFTEPILHAVDSVKGLVSPTSQSRSQGRESPATKKTQSPRRKIFTQSYPISSKLENNKLADLIVSYTNEFRDQNGLQPLKNDGNLARMAFVHSKDMADNNYFAIESPNGLGLTERKSILCRNIYGGFSENIAKHSNSNQSDENLAREVGDQWINRRGNQANILHSESDRIGVGVVKTPTETIVTQIFSNTVAIFDAPLPLEMSAGDVLDVTGRLVPPYRKSNVRFYLKKHKRGFFKAHIVETMDVVPIWKSDNSFTIRKEMPESGIYELVITHNKHGGVFTEYTGIPIKVL